MAFIFSPVSTSAPTLPSITGLGGSPSLSDSGLGGGQSSSTSIFGAGPIDLGGMPVGGGGLSGSSILDNSTSTDSGSGFGGLLSGIGLPRIAAGIIGLMCILAGLLMFKTSQTVITTAGKGLAALA